MSFSKLFQPMQVGDVQLEHRVVMAPLTRFRAHDNHAPSDLAVQYYEQRSRVPGTLIIAEGTFMDARTGGLDNVPALETPEQVAGWRKITEVVHKNKSFIFAQLWALGRSADPSVLARDGFPYVAASDIPLTGREAPRPLAIIEIKEFVQAHAKTASKAIEAGFDGVEVYGANGGLVDQFLQDVSNNRKDEYGGSIENRARFALEVIDAMVKEIGVKKVAIRLSPWGRHLDMRMKDPIPTFSYLIKKIVDLYPDLAYIHVVEPRVEGIEDKIPDEGESSDFLRKIWSPRPYIAAGGLKRDSAIEFADTKGDLVAFGRFFIANPDLPYRLKHDLPLNAYDRSTFYKVSS
ncbi:NADH:flavin oxidoreductase/NADH oxidase [Panus rudis PR-1116 ss-1]|nr:NADH:flavin oxidoreductase/NADH oxidase [Panus rudis PR-1116 ss-1]